MTCKMVAVSIIICILLCDIVKGINLDSRAKNSILSHGREEMSSNSNSNGIVDLAVKKL